MGTAAVHNNARVLNETATTVAAFRSGTTPFPSALFQLHGDGAIWRYTGTPCSGNSCPGWERLDNNLRTRMLSAGGADLYQLHTGGAIWRYTGTPCNGNSCPGWERLDNNARTRLVEAR